MKLDCKTIYHSVAPRELATDCYLIILLFAFPLFPGFSGYTNITLSKFVFLLCATGLYLATLLVLAISGSDCTPLPRLRAPQWAAVGFLAIATLSAVLSPFFPKTFLGASRYDGWISIAVYIIVFLCASLFTQPKPIHAIAFASAAMLCCGLAVFQLLGCNPLHLYPGTLRYRDAGIRYSGVYLGTIGNTNLLDAMLALVIPVCTVLGIKKQPAFFLPLALSLIVFFAAGGSGLYVSLAACLGAALLLLPKTKKQRTGCAVILAASAAAALAILWFWPGRSGSLYEFSQVLHGHWADSFGSSRILIWRNCLALISDRPLLGGGPGTAGLRLDIEFSRYVPETGATLRSYVDNTHNIYLGYLVNTGWLGLTAYLVFLTLCAIVTLRKFSESDLSAAIGLAAFCGAFHGLFGLGLCLTEPLFFALLGLCCTANESPKEIAKQ